MNNVISCSSQILCLWSDSLLATSASMTSPFPATQQGKILYITYETLPCGSADDVYGFTVYTVVLSLLGKLEGHLDHE